MERMRELLSSFSSFLSLCSQSYSSVLHFITSYLLPIFFLYLILSVTTYLILIKKYSYSPSSSSFSSSSILGTSRHLHSLITFIILPIVALQKLGLIKKPQETPSMMISKRKQVQPMVNKSFDDDYLMDKKTKTKFSNRIKQSMSWLYKLGRRSNKLIGFHNLGDGLDSIFATPPTLKRGKSAQSSLNLNLSSVDASHSFSNLNLSNLIGNLDKNQEFAFSALYDCGLFVGADTSALNELCSNAASMKKAQGESIISSELKKTAFLYILKSGKCSVSYIDTYGKQAVDTLVAGQVAGGVIDTISWICHCEIQRKMVIECSEPCEFVVLPSPRDEKGNFQSRAQYSLFSRVIRMLLIRFNRTTVLTAFFQFGLSAYFLPNFPRFPIDASLRSSILSKGRNSTARLDALNLLIKNCLCQLFGTQHGCDGELSSIADKLYYFNTDEAEESGSDCDDPCPTAVEEKVEDIFIPLQRRVLSFDSTIKKYECADIADDFKVYESSVELSQGSGLCLLKEGQNILDIDAIPGLYLILSGKLRVENTFQPLDLFCSRKVEEFPTLSDGDLVGQIALFAGSSEEWYGRRDGNVKPYLKVTALADSWLVKLSLTNCYKHLKDYPISMITLGERIASSLPPIIQLFDFCTKTVNLNGGDDLIAAGDVSHGELFCVLNGRLKIVDSEETAAQHHGLDYWARERSAEERVGGDYRMPIFNEKNLFVQGSLIGDTQLLTGEPHPYTVRAIRRTVLSKIPKGLLSILAQTYPSILTTIAHHVSARQHKSRSNFGSQRESKSIMVVPISGSVPLDLVVSRISASLQNYAQKVQTATSTIASTLVGGKDLHSITNDEITFIISNWMQMTELEYDVMIYQADWHPSAWNKICASQCDEILLVANALDEVESTITENEIVIHSDLIPKTLVMLHVNPAAGALPSGTRNWIISRDYINRHIHARLHCNNPTFDKSHLRSDFNRLARILTNNAIGLVLGGGGARGFCHLGVFQALEEAGIPVDIVGGTSIGSFMGALYAREQNYLSVTPLCRRWADKMSSIWTYLQDLTLPWTSYFNGESLSESIKMTFHDQKIEDLWLNYYCVTTDLSSHKERVHVNGTARRYIRASMSLANFLPPVCDVDPRDKSCHYLIDGGYVNIIPVDIMKLRFGAKLVIAVDVSGGWSLAATHDYGDILNGMSVLLSKLNPFTKTINVPSMADVATQIWYVAACRQIERTKDLADIYILTPVDDYSSLDFHLFDNIRQIGLECSRKCLKEWFQEQVSNGTSKFQSLIKQFNASVLSK